MLNKILRRIGFVFALGLAGVAHAETKIGFVNPARISNEAPQLQAARERLEKEFSTRKQDLARSQKEYKDLEEKFTRDAAVMKDSERQRMERDIMARGRELRRMNDELREDYNIRANDELGKLQRRIGEVIQQIAKEEKYDLVFSSDGVLYFSDQVDITSKVLDRLKRDFKAPAAK